MLPMKTRQQLLDMKAQINDDQAALSRILPAPEDKELLTSLKRHFTAELDIIESALEWQDRKRAIAANPSR